MGNKTKYCKAVVDRICRYIANGLNLKQSCQAAGVSETSLLVWRKIHPDFAERVEAAREVMRAKVLAEIKAAGPKDWRAHEAFLRLAFAEYRFGNTQTMNVAVQNNMSVTDPQRAELIAQRERALADKSDASLPLQLPAGDTGDARSVALETERSLQEERSAERLAEAEPERLREHAQRTVVERADWRDERSRPFRDWEEIGSEDGLG